ncbi:MAG: DUF3168 domain-containing protein [Gammaproteobacteria bacterium]|jgi:hypothetical protein|nr:DUF3168 domain-containing protein [Gammaproteobacteria bacterium]
MSSAQSLPVGTAAQVTRAVLDLLRADAGLREAFGTPPRIHDGEAGAPAYPFARLETVEESDAGSACVAAKAYRLSISTASRHGGRAYALELVGALRRALETKALEVPGGRVVLQQIVYADVLRSADQRRFRGLIRLKIVTEEDA